MRTYIDIVQELELLEKDLEENGKTQHDFKKWKNLGQILQLELFRGDIFELIEWIKKHDDKIDKEKLISKIQGEVIL